MHHLTERQLLEEIFRRVCAIEQRLILQGATMSKAIDDLTAAVAEETTVVDSAVTAFQGIADQIAKASNDPKVQELAQQVKAQAERLAAAIPQNTPAADPNAPQPAQSNNPPTT